jgi:hypothetical protein
MKGKRHTTEERIHILQKDADHHSSTYNNASMLFTERLTWDGVALHAGGLPGYPSSHGCIHLRYAFAERIFRITEVGGTVIITNDDPADDLTGGHRVQFESRETSEITRTPHDSPSGPTSILYSAKDKEVVIVRNGIIIGRGAAELKTFATKPKGTYAYVCEGWMRNKKNGEPHLSWHQVGGPADSHKIKSFSHLKTDPRLKHILDAAVAPGANLVITNDSISQSTKSQPGFHIMHGTLEKNRTKTRRESGYAITTPLLASKFAPFAIAKRGFFTIEFRGTPVSSSCTSYDLLFSYSYSLRLLHWLRSLANQNRHSI